MGKKYREESGHVGGTDRGSELVGKGPGASNHKQPQGKSIEAGTTDVAEHHKSSTFGGTAHSFAPPAANKAHGYGHAVTQRKGPLRMSGVKGAHRIGCK